MKPPFFLKKPCWLYPLLRRLFTIFPNWFQCFLFKPDADGENGGAHGEGTGAGEGKSDGIFGGDGKK